MDDASSPNVTVSYAHTMGEQILEPSQPILHYAVTRGSSSKAPDSARTHAYKRTLDICISLPIAILLFPLIVLLALLIWSQDDGPIFYLSRRMGRDGRVFTMYKFRTMIVGAEMLRGSLLARNERNAVLFKIPNDPRVTRIGRILRRYSLDELPQLINVLRGEMSLVGPRPPLPSEVEQYSPHQFIRLKVLPGITGLWQINARRSPSFHEYIALDAAYVQTCCLWLDVKILWRTIGVVLAGTGD